VPSLLTPFQNEICFKLILMKNFFFWLTRISGMSAIVFQFHRYVLTDASSWQSIENKSIFYIIAYLTAFNSYLIAGMILIVISHQIKHGNHSASD